MFFLFELLGSEGIIGRTDGRTVVSFGMWIVNRSLAGRSLGRRVGTGGNVQTITSCRGSFQ